MADNHNFASLDWVINEIGETLNQARQSLELYVQDPRDKTRIRFCLTHIHQVRGSLLMVEFFGAAMLAEEMELLTQAMINDTVDNLAEGQEVLMRAILQFPIYLNQVKTSREDNPLVVLPLLNDLRTVRGESLLADSNLFMPNLAPARVASGQRLALLNSDVEFKATVKKLRQMYQYAAAGFIKSVNTDENLGYLIKAFTRLHRLTSGTSRQPLWEISLALAEALEMDAVEPSVSVKNLLRNLDREIKVMAIHGVRSLNTPPSDELLRNLLYYVARSGKHVSGFSADSHLQNVYDKYALENALLEGKQGADKQQDLLASPDPEAMRSVVAALKAEMEVVKRHLDKAVTGDGDKETLAEAVTTVKRVADTLAVLGLGSLRRTVLEQGTAIESLLTLSGGLDTEKLIEVANHIVDIEGELDVVALNAGKSPAQVVTDQADITLSEAKSAVIREARNGLEQAKDAIVEYIASQWNREHLQNVPQVLRELCGSLEMLPLPRPARILSACARYIEEQLQGRELTPEWSTLDTLADAITSVEYYLERFGGESSEEENDLLLAVAEESVASLGYAVTRFSVGRADATSSTAETLEPAPEEEASAEGMAQQLQDAYSQAFAATEQEADTEFSATEPEEVVVADKQEEQGASEQLPSLPEASETEAATAQTSAVEDSDDDDDIDDEILEIFIEEAGEVTEAINTYFPRWAQNSDDEESLTEFRRAFHTLKGSGRMVGANDIGELAWAVENMLNRIIDGSVTSQRAHIVLVENVRQQLPDLIEAFAHKKPLSAPELIEQLRQQGEALARGEIPGDLDAQQPLPDILNKQVEAEKSQPQDTPLVVEFEEDDDDSQLWDIFGVEAESHLNVVNSYIARMEEASPLFEPPSDEMQRALHTLKGSAHMADVTSIAEVATPLERFVKELRSYQVNINEDILQ